MSRRSVQGLILALVLVLSGCSQPVPRVLVTADRAVITFPTPEKDQWEWSVKDSKTHSAEYQWRAIFPGSDGGVEIAFHCFKRPNTPPQKGSLQELLNWGQASAWTSDPDGARHVDEVVYVEAHAKGDHVELVVDGPFDVERVFSTYPTSARLIMINLGDKILEETVQVEYDGEVGWKGYERL